MSLPRYAAALLAVGALLTALSPSVAATAAEPAEAAVEPADAAAEPAEAAAEPAEVPVAAPAPPLSPDRFAVRLKGRIQARYTYDALDGEDDETAFSIPRARLAVSGHAFTEALAYKLQVDFGKGFVSLKDAFVDYAVAEGLQLRVGQYKRPFSRQQITSSGRLELVDRAITDAYFDAGRDLGLLVHDGYEHSPVFEWAFGIFNGTGEKGRFSGAADADGAVTGKFSNVPDRLHPALVARAGYNYGGIKGYREGDLEGGPLRFAVAGSGRVDLDVDGGDDAAVRGEVDYVVKAHGFSSTGAVYVASTQSGAGFADQSLDAVGFHLQAGYVVAGRFQPVVRYARVSPEGPDNDRQEVLGGLSVYFFEHGLKWQTDGGALVTETAGGSRTDLLVRTQLQLAF